METFADRLRWARERAGYTQRALADEIDVANQVSRWEQGTTASPRPENLLPLARVLGVSLPWLVSGEGSPDAPSRGIEPLDTPTLERFLESSEIGRTATQQEAQLLRYWPWPHLVPTESAYTFMLYAMRGAKSSGEQRRRAR